MNRKKAMIYDLGNPGNGLGQMQKCGRAGLINGIQSFSLLIIGSPITIQI
jgi:hypothetical protein